MEEKERKPKIRFKGFTEAWEQRKVNDLLELLTDYDANGSFADMANNVNTYDGSGYAWYVRMTDLENNEPLTKLKYVDKSSYDFMKKTHLFGGELLMAKRGEIGKVYIFQPRTRFATVAPNMYLLKLNKNVIPRFLHSFFISDYGNSKLQEINASTTMGAIYKDDVKNIELKIPNISEQEKIGDVFERIDNLITLHQRKYDKLVNVKKALLEKMFPKNDSNVPEIRFKGFTEAWEQRKVSDIANRYDNLRIPITANLREKGTTPYYGANGIQDYVKGYTHKGEFILVAEDGANDLKNYPVQYVNGSIWANNHVHVLQGKSNIADNKFLKYAISQSNIEALLVGGGRAKLNANIMMEMNIKLPQNIKEQIAIGDYIYRIDNLITLHQRKLEKLKNIKKSLLEKMFV